ncbi:MAG: MarC family protein [Acidiferrobacterales bacterium]|nr:MarC family protein [Acidiferrobacterales bacterium]
MEFNEIILNAIITLFVTIDPVGNAPIFLGLTAGFSAADRRRVAFRGVAIAFVILSLFALTGTVILDAMGISMAAFRVAGGLLLFYIAFEMIFAQRQVRREKTSSEALKEHVANIAAFPLAIPLLAGPGTISATILLSSQFSALPTSEVWIGKTLLVGMIFSLLLLTMLVLFAANYFEKLIGNTGRLVMGRLLGVLLAALSVQYVATGCIELFGQT